MQARIDRDNAQAGLERREHCLEKLSAVPLENGDTITLLQSERFQRQRQCIDAELFLCVRRARLPTRHCQSIRNLLRGARKVCADVQRRSVRHATPVYAQKLQITHTSNTVCHTMTCVGSRVWLVPRRAPIPALQWSRPHLNEREKGEA